MRKHSSELPLKNGLTPAESLTPEQDQEINQMPLSTLRPAPMVRAEPSAMALMSQAIERGSTPEALEKLYALKRAIDADEARKAFTVAMVELQSELPPIYKDKHTPQTKPGGKHWSYASLQAMVVELRPLWIKHGFTQRFTANTEGNRLTSICIFTHRLGHSEETRFSALVTNRQGDTLQDAASTDSFAKRYALMNAIGIVPEDDMEAMELGDARMIGAFVTQDQAEHLRQRVAETKSDAAKFLRAAGGAASFETIPAAQYKRLNNMLDQKAAGVPV